MRNRVMIALVLAATGAAAAQQVPRLEPQATGTGAITGRVVEAGTDKPVAGARLWLHQTRGETLSGIYPRHEQLTVDSSGAFAFRSLPAGQFSIAATADGYQSGAVGKRRPQGEEAWITLEAGQTFSNATIELFRGGTISGVVTNDRSEPMKGVHIGLWTRSSDGQLKSRHGAETDAAGAYRITEVPAGDHFVVAGVWHTTMRQGPPRTEPSPWSAPIPPLPPGVRPFPEVIEKPKYAEGEWFTSLPRWIPEPAPDDRGQPRTIPTTIYPGVSDVSLASVVTILAGEDRTGIDLQLRPTTTTTIKGRVVPLPGKKIGNASEVRLRLPGTPSDSSEHMTWIQPDNTFRFVHVPPGSYVLEVELREGSGHVFLRNSEDILTQMPLDVPRAGLDDVVVAIASGFKMQGRIRFDGKAPRPQATDIWLTTTSGGDEQKGGWDDGEQIIVDGLIPGGYALNVADNALSATWFLRSMTLGRLDLAVSPLTIDRADVSGVEVTMTDRPSPLDGRIVDAKGNVVRGATVVAFPVDRSTWPTAHDYLAGFARTQALDGTYRFAHLVPGDYFITAVDERRIGDWPRAGFLEAIATQAAPVRIAPGEALTLQLTLQTR